MASPFLYQPSPRFLQCAAQIGEKTYLWGGRTQDFSTSAQKTLASELNTFDAFSETWDTRVTTGTPPPGLYDGGCMVIDNSLYYFGGQDGYSFYNSLHCINSITAEWKELSSQNPVNQPMPKAGFGIVTYTDTASLAVFAGYGIPHHPTQTGTRFVEDTNFTIGSGWTNEFHLFNLTNGMWVSLCCPPVYSSSFTHLQYGSTEGRVGVLGDLVMCMVSSRQRVDTWRVVSKSSKIILPLIVRLLEILCKLNK